MSSRYVGLSLFLILAIALPSLATNNQQIVLYDPAGGPTTAVIDGSKPSYVSQGWTRVVEAGVPASVVHDEMTVSGFELEIDGVRIEPSSTNITRNPAKRSFLGVAMWDYKFTYRFPARHFEAGIHTFVATWFWPDPDNPGSTLSGGFAHQVLVEYP